MSKLDLFYIVAVACIAAIAAYATEATEERDQLAAELEVERGRADAAREALDGGA